MIFKKGKERKNRIIGIGVFILTLIVYFVLIPWQVYVPSGVKGTALSPEFFPKLITGVLALLSLLLIFVPGAPSGEIEKKEKLDLIPFRVAIMIILFVVYVFILIPIIGFLPSSIIFLALFTWYAGTQDWKKIMFFSISIPLVFFYIFKLWASVPFPRGIFFR